ncbi:MAG: bifunctional UDP-N-acetylglucosamine diphosphorylase/glucosamine-1-phosphate N-acetyltransferase GlmU [Armatimonadota bacterium]
MKNKTAVIILAAGKSKRMKTGTVKVLHKVSGKHIIDYVFDAAGKAKLTDICLVVGYQAGKLKETYKGKVLFAEQAKQLGTGHAVEVGLKSLKKRFDNVVILYGDMPLIEAGDIKKLVNYHNKNKFDATVLSVKVDNPGDFGRIIRNKSGSIEGIIEVKDATPAQLKINEVNTGIYCFKFDALKKALSGIGYANKQKEKYLTDTVSYLVKKKASVSVYVSDNKNLAVGINTRVDLANVNDIINKAKLEKLMLSGVTVIDPRTTYIHNDVKIMPDTVIHPFTIIEGKTSIGPNCSIGPFVRITDSVIENDVGIGPFAYIRPGTVINDNAKIGDFVEIKNSKVGSYSKVPHLSYIGDSILGQRVNIGAGVITCNYDGLSKNQTVISDNCFVGANCNLVAPVKLGKGSKTGAGSVVTKDVPDNTLAVGIPARAIKKLKK